MSSTLLRISEAASLALHASVIIAANPGQPVPAGSIAGLLGASEAHLAKVLQDLTKAGLVRSIRGPKGGFVLNRPAVEIALLDVFEAIEGPLNPSSCISLHKPSFCQGSACVLGGLTLSINNQVKQYLASHRVADFVAQFANTRLSVA